MRTTLTLDEDIAARLKQLEGFDSFKEAVNAVMRAGLDQLAIAEDQAAQNYRVQGVALGAKIHNLDNIGDVLEIIEGSDLDFS